MFIGQFMNQPAKDPSVDHLIVNPKYDEAVIVFQKNEVPISCGGKEELYFLWTHIYCEGWNQFCMNAYVASAAENLSSVMRLSISSSLGTV